MLSENHTLFLKYIDRGGKDPQSIEPKTASFWLYEMMKAAKINTDIYKPHSLRSASTTKAVESSIPTDQLKIHANWILNSKTFEQGYLKPRDQFVQGTSMTEAVFRGAAEKITTFKIGVEAGPIMEDTNNNSFVVEMETEDVVATHLLQQS